MERLLTGVARLGAGVATVSFVGGNCLYNVEGGHRAVMFDQIRGVLPKATTEGTGFKIPILQTPIIMDVRSRPREIRSVTGTKDLQMVNIYLRVLSRPREDKLPEIWQKLGTNFDDRVTRPRGRPFSAVPRSEAGRGAAAGCHVDIIPRGRIVRALDGGDAAVEAARRRDPAPRNIRAAAAASPRIFARHPRRRRDPPRRIIHVLAAASPRLVSAECPPRRAVDDDDAAQVLPSVGNEVLKSVVAQYNADQLLSMREQISSAARRLSLSTFHHPRGRRLLPMHSSL